VVRMAAVALAVANRMLCLARHRAAVVPQTVVAELKWRPGVVVRHNQSGLVVLHSRSVRRSHMLAPGSGFPPVSGSDRMA